MGMGWGECRKNGELGREPWWSTGRSWPWQLQGGAAACVFLYCWSPTECQAQTGAQEVFTEQVKEQKRFNWRNNLNRTWGLTSETEPPLMASCVTPRATSPLSWVPGSVDPSGWHRDRFVMRHIWCDLSWSDLVRQVCHLSKTVLSDICQPGTLHTGESGEQRPARPCLDAICPCFFQQSVDFRVSITWAAPPFTNRAERGPERL
jgi:hypothetical protein